MSKNNVISREGYDKLWGWFSISYSSFLTLPRVLMHEMPDEWQSKMADLMQEWDDRWDFSSLDIDPIVQFKKDGKFSSCPKWLINYRHPDKSCIDLLRKAANE